MIWNNEGLVLRITELVTDSGFKKSKFANEVGIDPSNFGKKLDGKLKFTDSDLKLIINYTNVRMVWLLTGEGDKFEDNESRMDENPTLVTESTGEFNMNVQEEIIRLTMLMTANDEIINSKRAENENIMKRLNALCTILKNK